MSLPLGCHPYDSSCPRQRKKHKSGRLAAPVHKNTGLPDKTDNPAQERIAFENRLYAKAFRRARARVTTAASAIFNASPGRKGKTQ